jgi:cation diffusion facilitator family transporter
VADRSTATVLVAGVANIGVAAAKLVAGVVTGSAALLAEAAHSIADTLNEVFLLTALTRSSKPADSRHPFGYGKERYFWSLLSAVGIFVLGAGFSIYQGVTALVADEPLTQLRVAYAVLGAAFLFDGVSWWKAARQLRGEAREQRTSAVRHVLHTTDPAAKTVAFEDTAALLGVLLAAGGITLDVILGSRIFDALASILIGLLLVTVAYALGRQNMRLLVGQGVSPTTAAGISRVINESTGVDVLVELLTMRLGPEEVLVAARVDMEDDFTGDDVERVADKVDRRVREAYPEVRHVFVDPTPKPGSD